jgi:DNA polymerase-4
MAGGSILHLNVVGLMAAVEEGLEPGLRGRPFVVGREGRGRSIVLDLSPEAHRAGIRRGMGLEAATRANRDLLVREPRPELYARADAELFRLASGLSPLVERAGMGHLFIDFAGTGGLWGPPADAALRLRAEILAGPGLLPSLALASTKVAARVATRVMRPTGFIVLGEGEDRALVRSQPVELLPGVGPLLLGRLRLLEIEEIGALADLDELCARALGPRGPLLRDRASLLEHSAVDPAPPERRRIASSLVLDGDSADPAFLATRARSLVAELGFAMRREGFGTRRVALGLSLADGRRSEASTRLSRPLLRDDELGLVVEGLLAKARSARVRVRGISLELGEFAPAGPELDLFEPVEAKRGRLQSALDGVKRRYGLSAIGSAAALAAQSHPAALSAQSRLGEGGAATRAPA